MKNELWIYFRRTFTGTGIGLFMITALIASNVTVLIPKINNVI